MWSRKPMPVFMLIVCDLLVWLAWPSLIAASRRESVSGGKEPPSRFKASCILVSLVSRAIAAHRRDEEAGAMAAYVDILEDGMRRPSPKLHRDFFRPRQFGRPNTPPQNCPAIGSAAVPMSESGLDGLHKLCGQR